MPANISISHTTAITKMIMKITLAIAMKPPAMPVKPKRPKTSASTKNRINSSNILSSCSTNYPFSRYAQ